MNNVQGTMRAMPATPPTEPLWSLYGPSLGWSQGWVPLASPPIYDSVIEHFCQENSALMYPLGPRLC